MTDRRPSRPFGLSYLEPVPEEQLRALRAAAKALADSAGKAGSFQPLAVLLDAASKAEGEARVAKLDEATRWLRHHHPGAKVLWEGWEERDGKLVEMTSTKTVKPGP